jgi:hypothetical protein
MGHHESAYYPPRARWYRGLFGPWYGVRKWLRLERLVPAGGFKSFNRLVGAYGLSFVVFVVWLGYDVSNWAFGLMVGLHATSAAATWSRWAPVDEFKLRLTQSLKVLLVVGLLVYWPLRTVLVDYVAMPLRMQDRVVVVNPRARVRRGDWVAYRMAGVQADHMVWTQAGMGFDRVLAVTGERVRFLGDRYEINGRFFPLLARMPGSGEWIVPEKHWLIWPNLLASGGHGNVAQDTVSSAVQQMALVPHSELAGKVYGRWFWRRQVGE